MPVPEHPGQVSAALRMIVAEHGVDALSNAPLMTGLMSDLLPDAPREAQVLRVAAEQRLAAVIQDHVANGMDGGVASGLVASSFAARTMFPRDICRWVTDELAAVIAASPQASGDAATSQPALPAGFSMLSGHTSRPPNVSGTKLLLPTTKAAPPQDSPFLSTRLVRFGGHRAGRDSGRRRCARIVGAQRT